jgi:hypothetical protein
MGKEFGGGVKLFSEIHSLLEVDTEDGSTLKAGSEGATLISCAASLHPYSLKEW